MSQFAVPFLVLPAATFQSQAKLYISPAAALKQRRRPSIKYYITQTASGCCNNGTGTGLHRLADDYFVNLDVEIW